MVAAEFAVGMPANLGQQQLALDGTGPARPPGTVSRGDNKTELRRMQAMETTYYALA